MESRTDIDLIYFKRRLDEEKALAEEAIAGTRFAEKDGTGTMGMEGNETSGGADENHPADAGTDLQLREQDDALIRNAQEILAQIARAQARMDDGKYGLSERSGEPIPKERLEAVPYATLTVEEQRVEEGLLTAEMGALI